MNCYHGVAGISWQPDAEARLWEQHSPLPPKQLLPLSQVWRGPLIIYRVICAQLNWFITMFDLYYHSRGCEFNTRSIHIHVTGLVIWSINNLNGNWPSISDSSRTMVSYWHTQVSAPHPGQDQFGLPYWKVWDGFTGLLSF